MPGSRAAALYAASEGFDTQVLEPAGPASAMFVLIGAEPRTDRLDGVVGRDERGDVRYRSVKQVASAVGEGSIAVQLVHEYLSEPQGPAGG